MGSHLSRWLRASAHRRAERALARQLEYQRNRARAFAGRIDEPEERMRSHSRSVRTRLEAIRPIGPTTRVLEVGSGSQGVVFFFGTDRAVGVDPLADHYREMLPWQRRVETLAVGGENLPFADASFDLVLSVNVVDHAEDPRRIIEEVARVLVPGGLFYFTVNVHSRFWHGAAVVHAVWKALGLPGEVTPFADHTVHLTLRAARDLFSGLPFRFLSEEDNIREHRAATASAKLRRPSDLAKRLFFKNATWKLVAVREGAPL